MATVILARHGRTQANATGVLAGRTKGVHLDETGIAQAKAAAERLTGLDLAAAVTSPLERCRETAKILLAESTTKLQTDRGLNECDYGDWAGQQLQHLVKDKLWKNVQTNPAGTRFPGGESMAEMAARAVAAVRDWDAGVDAEVGPEAVWLAVSHGDIIKSVLADALGMHLDLFQRIVVEPASLSVIRYTSRRTFVVMMNSHSGNLAHLATPRRQGRRRKPVHDGDAVIGGDAGPAPVTPATPTA
ncbi:MAG: Phosphoglycerate mutase [Marmoricola sp.]|jgi:probable phosphomutase (TIGR03848 family)|nr:Phosphoglycerate mutase [Marmoricola sp.]